MTDLRHDVVNRDGGAMTSKKKAPKKMTGGDKRKVGAVVIKRRGAKARLKSALRSAGNKAQTGAGDKSPASEDGHDKDAKGLKTRISHIKTRTKAIATKLAKSRKGRSPSK